MVISSWHRTFAFRAFAGYEREQIATRGLAFERLEGNRLLPWTGFESGGTWMLPYTPGWPYSDPFLGWHPRAALGLWTHLGGRVLISIRKRMTWEVVCAYNRFSSHLSRGLRQMLLDFTTSRKGNVRWV